VNYKFSRLLLCLALLPLASGGRPLIQNPQSPSTTPAPGAKSSDVDTIEHIVAAAYASISGPPGPRDWDRLRSLFYTGARMVPSHRDAKGAIVATNLSVEDYIERGKPYFAKEGFYENSVANRVESWDHIAHVWSTYESRHAKDDKPFARGINSFQLFNDGSRWWILSIYWEGEEKDHPLPEKYLKQ
jgi:hypothetical protein